MVEVGKQTTFECSKCGRAVELDSPGTKYRNHCPWCLWSVHVASNRVQDDRSSACLGLMEPIAISVQGEEWAVVHRCATCGVIKTNRIAGDDDMFALICVALRPMANMPVPLHFIPERASERGNLQTGGTTGGEVSDESMSDEGVSDESKPTTFACGKCGRVVESDSSATKYRNHCPSCLWSIHVASTQVQDDRLSACVGLMEPIAISLQGEEWALVHRCATCGVIKTNGIAGDDDMFALIRLAVWPIANTPVPLQFIPEEVRERYKQDPGRK